MHSEQEQGVADGIAMLEQILEVMPRDVEALRAVYSAYLKGGDMEGAFDYLKRLADVVVGEEGDPESLAFVREQFLKFETHHPSEVASRLARLRILEGSDAESDVDASDGREAGRVELDISEELALAWRLYEEHQLSQEEYSSVLHDLTEISTRDVGVPVSVLHVLNDRGFTQMDRVMAHLSERSGVPFLRLSGFEIDEKIAEILPLRFAARDGALVFGSLGDDVLVGVLNPFDSRLADRVESEVGRRCHAYLVAPEDYDGALEKLKAFDEAS